MRFVTTNNLQPGMVIAKNITNASSSLMLRRGLTLSESLIAHLNEQGYQGCYISDIFSEDVEAGEPVSEQTVQKGLIAVKEGNVASLVTVAANIVSDVTVNKNVSPDLYDLRSIDEYTYHHSVNVAVYCGIVGRKLGLGPADTELLVLSAICHDLGKSKIPLSVLNKPDKLTDEEYETIKKHTIYSYEMLSGNSSISTLVKEAVLYHHENENGSGYPSKKMGNEIPIFAKIIHAVDVYDALTNKRPYKDPFAPSDALQYLVGGKGILFDDKVVDAMLEVIPAYPPGIDVDLSNGMRALVIKNSGDARRPVIKLFENSQIIDLSTNKEFAEVTITRSGIMPQDYVGEIESLNEDRQEAKATRAKIIVVDSARVSLMMTAKVLADEYNVESFSTSLEAIKHIKENPQIDLMLIDMDMPVVDGLGIVKKVRAANVTAPVIFLSGNANASAVLKCKEAGAIDYILKPINTVYLMRRVQIALKQSND